MLKTHGCGELRPAHIGSQVTLAGWVHRRRDHGGLIFIDLRDRSGLAQVVFNPAQSPKAHEVASAFRNEWVVQVQGRVAQRPPGTENAKLPTGAIEVMAESATALNPAKTLPFAINEEAPIEETLRLQYRYLDLRREVMQRNLRLRHQAIRFMHEHLDARGFIEIETPVLMKSTPEGARDYIVPSRVQPGMFYALPQSPQQLKQLLMVAGFERYYQIARCFRDEDLRADRQPEFTQLDLEMSFVEQNDILDLMEGLITSLVEEVTPHFKILKPFPRLTCARVMDKYGTDKPDLRFGLELADLSEIAARTELNVFKTIVAKGGVVKGFAAPGCGGYTRKQTDDLIEFVRTRGAQGLVTIALPAGKGLDQLAQEDIKSQVAKFLTPARVREMAQGAGAKPGDLILIVAGEKTVANTALSQLRHEMGKRLGLADPNLLAFGWVLNFPLLEWKPEENRWDSPHNPFCAPMDEDLHLLDSDPGKAMAKQYDLICNGYETGGGSIRNHRREIQEKVLALMGHTKESRQAQFGQLLDALEYGAPPHGGIAVGVDRLVMLLAGEDNIRQTMAFPKTQSAADLMMGAPSPVPPKHLQELCLEVRPPRPPTEGPRPQ